MKTLTTIVATMAVCGGAFAQGTFTMQNSAATLVQTDHTSTGGTVVSTPTADGVKLELLYAPETGAFASSAPALLTSGSSLNGTTLGGWELTDSTAALAAAGRFVAGTKTTGNDLTGGANAWLEIVAWNGGAASFLTAISGGTATFIGNSASWSNVSGAPNGAPPTNPQLLVLGPSGFNGLVLEPVPEPSTIALGGLGAAALLALRRRK